MEERKKLGIALVGLGMYSTNQLAPALENTKLCRLTGIVTGSKQKGNDWRKKYKLSADNIYNYENFDEVAGNPEIDVIYVVLPNSMHAEFTIRAARAGKHVIVEKPMAISSRESEEMIRECEKAGVKLFVGYRLHFEPYNQEIMMFRDRNIFGGVRSVESGFGFKAGNPYQWRLDKKMAGGGALMDVGIYCVQAARYSTGQEPVSVKASIKNEENDERFQSVEGNISWEFEFPDGAIARCEASYSRPMDFLAVQYSDGFAKIEPAFYYSGQKGRTSKGEIELYPVNQQARQLDGMADAIINGTRIRATGEEGLQDMRVIEAIYESARTGQKIRIPEMVHA